MSMMTNSYLFTNGAEYPCQYRTQDTAVVLGAMLPFELYFWFTDTVRMMRDNPTHAPLSGQVEAYGMLVSMEEWSARVAAVVASYGCEVTFAWDEEGREEGSALVNFRLSLR